MELLPSSSPRDMWHLLELLSKSGLWSIISCRLAHGRSMECPQVAISVEPLVAAMYHTTSVGVAPRSTANKVAATATSHSRDEVENGDLRIARERDITLFFLQLVPSLLFSEGLVVLTRSDCTTNIFPANMQRTLCRQALIRFALRPRDFRHSVTTKQ